MTLSYQSEKHSPMTAKTQSLLLHQTLTQVKDFAKIKSEQDLRLKVKEAFFAEYDVDVEDETFNELDKALKNALRTLALNIRAKVYEYGFLKR